MAITILKQVMEEKLDATNVEVASVRMTPAKPEVPVSAACHYVPGPKTVPQFAMYTKEQLEEALARVAAAWHEAWSERRRSTTADSGCASAAAEGGWGGRRLPTRARPTRAPAAQNPPAEGPRASPSGPAARRGGQPRWCEHPRSALPRTRRRRTTRPPPAVPSRGGRGGDPQCTRGRRRGWRRWRTRE